MSDSSFSHYQAIAIRRYRAPPGSSTDALLQFDLDDIITITAIVDEDYLKGEKDGKEGVLPSDSVERIESKVEKPVESIIPSPVLPSLESSEPIIAETIETPAGASPPPTPKKSSTLKERIAALNAAGAGAASPAIPPPKPKKPLRNWSIPSAPSTQPPILESISSSIPSVSTSIAASLPTATLTDTAATPSKVERDGEGGAMSASDAKQSISKGGSLKDRIAALQGLKLDSPSAPGRAPKVMKKAEEIEGVEEGENVVETEKEVKEPPVLLSLDTNISPQPDSIPLPPSATSISSPVPMPAIPKRAGPPKRRAPAASTLPVTPVDISESVSMKEAPVETEVNMESNEESKPLESDSLTLELAEASRAEPIILEEIRDDQRSAAEPQTEPDEKLSAPSLLPSATTIDQPEQQIEEETPPVPAVRPISSSRPAIPASYAREVVPTSSKEETVALVSQVDDQEEEGTEKVEEVKVKSAVLPPRLPPPAAPITKTEPLVVESNQSEDLEEEIEISKVEVEPVEIFQEDDAETEEEDSEVARRAAITARMAKLGGRSMGLGAMFAAPPKAKKVVETVEIEEIAAPVEVDKPIPIISEAPQFRLPSIPGPSSAPALITSEEIEESSIDKVDEEFDIVDSEEAEEQFEDSNLDEDEEEEAQGEEDEAQGDEDDDDESEARIDDNDDEVEETAPPPPPRSYPSPPPHAALPTYPSNESVFDNFPPAPRFLPPTPRSLPPAGILPSLPSIPAPTSIETPALMRDSSDYSSASILDVDIPSASFSLDDSTLQLPEVAAEMEHPVIITTPNSYSLEQLKEFSSSLGTQIFAAGHSKLAEKKSSITGPEFIKFVFSKAPSARPPTGDGSFGYLVYSISNKSITVDEDEPRIGDLITFLDCKFKQNLGSVKVSTTAVVSGWDEKKRKLHYFSVEKTGVEEASWRVDDLKSGTINVYRAIRDRVV